MALGMEKRYNIWSLLFSNWDGAGETRPTCTEGTVQVLAKWSSQEFSKGLADLSFGGKMIFE